MSDGRGDAPEPDLTEHLQSVAGNIPQSPALSTLGMSVDQRELAAKRLQNSRRMDDGIVDAGRHVAEVLIYQHRIEALERLVAV